MKNATAVTGRIIRIRYGDVIYFIHEVNMNENETLEIARDVARKLLESYLQHEGKLPAKIKNKLIKSIDIPLAVGVS